MYILRSGAVECRSVQGSDPTIRDRESSGGEGEIEIEVGDCFGEEALFPVCIFRRTETRASCQMIASWQWHSVPHAQVLVLVSQCQHICEPIRSVLELCKRRMHSVKVLSTRTRYRYPSTRIAADVQYCHVSTETCIRFGFAVLACGFATVLESSELGHAANRHSGT
eukprot:3340678-Rhodomonas_salina.3